MLGDTKKKEAERQKNRPLKTLKSSLKTRGDKLDYKSRKGVRTNAHNRCYSFCHGKGRTLDNVLFHVCVCARVFWFFGLFFVVALVKAPLTASNYSNIRIFEE